MHDVGGNGDAAVCHALADVFGVAMLAIGDLLHLRCDLPGAGEVDLRDELGLGLCAHWHGSLRWHYPYQVCGSGGRAQSQPAVLSCKLPVYVVGSSIARMGTIDAMSMPVGRRTWKTSIYIGRRSGMCRPRRPCPSWAGRNWFCGACRVGDCLLYLDVWRSRRRCLGV